MKTFIWDVDGTLVDSYEILTKNVHQIFSQYLDITKEEIFESITDTSIRSFFLETTKKHDLPLEEIYLSYKALDDAVKAEDYKLIKDCSEVLNAMSDKGCKHYIYTHRGRSTYDILKINNLEDIFIEVVTSDNGFERKPSPQALDYLIDKYNLDKSTTCYVGDRTLDVESGNNAGLKTIYFNEVGKTNNDANHSVKALKEILEII